MKEHITEALIDEAIERLKNRLWEGPLEYECFEELAALVNGLNRIDDKINSVLKRR